MFVLNKLPEGKAEPAGASTGYTARYVVPLLRRVVDALNQLLPPVATYDLRAIGFIGTGGSSTTWSPLNADSSEHSAHGYFCPGWAPEVWGSKKRVFRWHALLYWYADGSTTATSVEFCLQDLDTGVVIAGSEVSLAVKNTVTRSLLEIDLSTYSDVTIVHLGVYAKTTGGSATHDEPKVYDSKIIASYE